MRAVLKQEYFAFLATGIVGIALVAYLYLSGGDSRPDPAVLADAALSGGSTLERTKAAIALADYGDGALSHLRRVYRETQESDVLAVCVEGLGKHWDYESMDLLLLTAERGPVNVRGRAAAVISRMTGRDRRFRANASQDERDRLVRFMREDWNEIRLSPYFDDLKQRLRASHEGV